MNRKEIRHQSETRMFRVRIDPNLTCLSERQSVDRARGAHAGQRSEPGFNGMHIGSQSRLAAAQLGADSLLTLGLGNSFSGQRSRSLLEMQRQGDFRAQHAARIEAMKRIASSPPGSSQQASGGEQQHG